MPAYTDFVTATPTLTSLAKAGGCAAKYPAARLEKLLAERCGFEVSRANYLNDRGTQMQLFAASLAARTVLREQSQRNARPVASSRSAVSCRRGEVNSCRWA